MGYCDRTAAHRTLYPVPVKPVLEAIERWLEEQQERSGWEPNAGNRNRGIASPMQVLAARAGVKEATCARQLSRFRNETSTMSLLLAERYIDATYGDVLWDSPELAGCRPKPPRDMHRTWMTVEEKESPRRWARRVALAMTPRELREVAQAIDPSALEVDDHSSSARRARARERFPLDPHPYAKLEQPFGAKARGEMAA